MFSVSSPEELTNKHIQNIGKRYLELYGSTPSLFHENHPIANLLKNYADDSSVEEKWIFLSKVYTQLNSAFYSTIGYKIISLFSEAFQRRYDTYFQTIQPSIDSVHFIAGILEDKARAYFLAKEVKELKETVREFTIN